MVVVGNNVAALIAALTLGEAGWQVTLLSPSPRLGGHFGGLSLGGEVFDAGMVFLEFTSFNADPKADVGSYDPMRKNDVGRFFPLIERTLGRFGSFVPVTTPQMRVQGRTLPDLLVANRIDSLQELEPATKESMRRELQDIGTVRGPLHASQKLSDAGFGSHDLATVSLANHGRTFHELFVEPFCRKVTGRPSSSLVGLFHRLAWLPLFYPETLASVFGGHPQVLPPTTFTYPSNGAVVALVREIEAAVRALPNVAVVVGKVTTVDRRAGRAFTITCGSAAPLDVDRLVWAADPESLLGACGEPAAPPLERVSLTLASALAASDEVTAPCSTLFLPEGPHLPFRVTNQSFSSGRPEPWSRLSCEWNGAVLTGPQTELAQQATSALVELGVVQRRQSVREIRVDTFADAFVLPTPANLTQLAQRRSQLDLLLPDVPRLGPAAPFGAASLNDQIVQGLKVGRQLGSEEG